jgi:hypothetical protein
MMHISRLLYVFLYLIPVLSLSFNSHGQRYVVSGVVLDKEKGDTLAGVNIFIPLTGEGAVTDPRGFYSISLPEGEHEVVYSFVGYKTLRKAIFLDEDLSFDAELEKSNVQLNEVVITSGHPGQNVDRAEMGIISMQMEDIINIPAFLGEVDVLRTVQLLPGVQSAGDGNTGFFVRGGDSDQNLVLFDDAVVFNASHLFNFFSIFNPDAVKDLKLYKGGIPPSYGGRLSSVLDISMKEGNMDNLEVNGGIGLISSRLSAGGPIQKNRSSFMVAGRRTYADMFLKLSNDENQRDTRLYFYDFNAKMNYVLNEKNRVYISGYYGRDITAFKDVFAVNWGNTMGSIRWNRIFSEKFTGNLSMMYSDYAFNIGGNVDPANFTWNSSVSNLTLQTGFVFLPGQNNKYSFGISGIYHKLDPGVISSGFGHLLSEFKALSPSNAIEFSAYFRNEHRFWDNRMAFDYGLRGSLFQVIGPGRQYEFDKSNHDSWRVTDTLLMKKGELYDRFNSLEPRISVRYKLTDGSSVKAGFNRMTQYVQQAQSAQSVAPYDVWFMSNNNIPPQTADQLVLGIFP